MADDFVLKEYEHCFEQLRFYDKREESILKYTFSLVSAVATALFAVYKYFQERNQQLPLDGFAALLLLLFLITVLLFFAAISNRYYFVTLARQVNAIRLHFLKEADEVIKSGQQAFGTQENRMWTNSDWPYLHPSSVHTYILWGLAVISSLTACVSVYLFLFDVRPVFRWAAAALTFAAVLAGEVKISGWQLRDKPKEEGAKKRDASSTSSVSS